jgi:hypothetical protein
MATHEMKIHHEDLSLATWSFEAPNQWKISKLITYVLLTLLYGTLKCEFHISVSV